MEKNPLDFKVPCSVCGKELPFTSSHVRCVGDHDRSFMDTRAGTWEYVHQACHSKTYVPSPKGDVNG